VVAKSNTSILTALATAHLASGEAKLSRGRIYGIQRALVTNDGVSGRKRDPQNRRRIKATIPSKGLTETGWLESLNIEPYSDPPLPRVGSIVFVMFVDGNPHDGIWFGSTINSSNPATDQSDALNDNARATPGDDFRAVNGDEYDLVKGDRDVETEGDLDCLIEGSEFHRCEKSSDTSVGRDLTLGTDSGCELHHSRDGHLYHRDRQGAGLFVAGGAAVIQDKYGNRLVLGGGGASISPSGALSATESNEVSSLFTTDFIFDLQGNSLHIVNAGNVTINGTAVTTVPHEHPDSKGQATSKGY